MSFYMKNWKFIDHYLFHATTHSIFVMGHDSPTRKFHITNQHSTKAYEYSSSFTSCFTGIIDEEPLIITSLSSEFFPCQKLTGKLGRTQYSYCCGA